MSGRFRIDPRDPAPDRAIPPPPSPPAAPKPGAPAVTPLAPRPAPMAPKPATAAPAARKNRRALIIGAVVIALLLVGGGVAIYAATALSYPEKYTLESKEMPRGVSNARLSQSEMQEIGIRSNPGAISEDRLGEFATNDGRQADEGNMQVLSTSGGRVVVLALKYSDEDDAALAARDARALCSFNGASVLRDEKIIVLIFSEDGAGRTSITAVRDALRQKTSDLKTVCG